MLTDIELLHCEKSLRRSDIQEAFGTELISETIPQFLLRAVVGVWDAVRWDGVGRSFHLSNMAEAPLNRRDSAASIPVGGSC